MERSVAMLERIALALGVPLRLDLAGGADLDRLLDAEHAGIQERLAGLLRRAGWDARPEVSFNHFGDRGRYDLAAFHPGTGTMLAVEVKSVLGDLQETLGRLDVKVRLGPTVGEGLGWSVRRTLPVLVLAESGTSRRQLRRYSELFARFNLRGRAALAWFRSPAGDPPTGIVLLLASPSVRQASTGRRPRTDTRPGTSK